MGDDDDVRKAEQRRIALANYPDKKIKRFAIGEDSPKAAKARRERSKKKYKTESKTHTNRGVLRVKTSGGPTE